MLISEHSEHLIFADCWTIFIQYGYLVEYFCPGLLQASKGRLLSEVDAKKKKRNFEIKKEPALKTNGENADNVLGRLCEGEPKFNIYWDMTT